MNEMVLLKKYSNRRLYDTSKSAYVTLNDVSETIKQDKEVKVVDAKTGEDVTAFILTQIILEEARQKNTLLPVPLLHLIIRYGEGILQEFFDKYLQQTIYNYLQFKKIVDEQFSKWLDIGFEYTNLAQKSMAQLSPLTSFFDQFTSMARDKKDKKT